jgi:hypothetical protein
MEKSKEISLRQIVDLHKSGSSLGAISQTPEGTTTKDLVKMLGETGTKVSISTVKRALYRHNLKGRSARKKPLLQNRLKKS